MERDELRERRAARLSPAGRDLLREIERSLQGAEFPDPGPYIERIQALPPKDGEEIAAIVGAMAQEFAERQRENMRGAAFAQSAADAIREAKERERAAGMPVDTSMTLGDALEILGR